MADFAKKYLHGHKRNTMMSGRDLHPNIAVTIDDSYAMPTAVMLRSLAENFRGHWPVYVWVINEGLTRKSKNRIRTSLKGFDIRLNWVNPSRILPNILSHAPKSELFPPCLYYSLLAPMLVPETVSKLLYLDVDMIVRGNIQELYESDMKGKPLMAVKGYPNGLFGENNTALCEAYGLPLDTLYLNAGVLLYDCGKWRSRQIDRVLTDFFRRYGHLIKWTDQDVLNSLFANDWAELHSQWNYRLDPYLRLGPEEESRIREDINSKVNIVHFASSTKPWHGHSNSLAKELFIEYREKTWWRDWHPPQPFRVKWSLWKRSVSRTVFNKYWYGACLRQLPVVGPGWARFRDYHKKVPSR